MGGMGRGGDRFSTGRKLGAADLQLLILALLAEKPSHGYELIKALEERSGGFYSPSPGVIYPALTYLEEIGYATVEAEGTKKLYRLTDAGRHELERNRAAVEAMLSALRASAARWTASGAPLPVTSRPARTMRKASIPRARTSSMPRAAR